MALDLVVLGENGIPERSVPIGHESHQRLMECATASRLVLLCRLDDYYGDAAFSNGELPLLAAEVQQVLSEYVADEKFAELMTAIGRLISFAAEEGSELKAFAD